MTARLEKAIAFMKAAHRSIDQRRKDGVRLYEVHPLDVLARLQAAGVTDEDVLIAGLLHDVIEDVFPKHPGYDIYLITREFGEAVAKYVVELTDVYVKSAWPDLNRAKRKQLERERYATFSTGAKLVKLADIGSNLSDDGEVLESDGRPEVGFNRMFIKEKALCLQYLKPIGNEQPTEVWVSMCLLYIETEEILAEQKKKFDVR